MLFSRGEFYIFKFSSNHEATLFCSTVQLRLSGEDCYTNSDENEMKTETKRKSEVAQPNSWLSIRGMNFKMISSFSL